MLCIFPRVKLRLDHFTVIVKNANLIINYLDILMRIQVFSRKLTVEIGSFALAWRQYNILLLFSA